MLRFECQQSGNCCVTHGESGYLFLTRDDRIRLASHLGISLESFLVEYCAVDENRNVHLKEPFRMECIFLKDRKCSVYEARPNQCRTWPFWEDNMTKARKWNSEVKKMCPGIGKGPDIRTDEAEQIVKQSKASVEL